MPTRIGACTRRCERRGRRPWGVDRKGTVMKILVAHNSYQQVGGEDHVVAAEIAMLEAHGHEVVPYRLSNHAVEGMRRLALGARTIWSRAAFLGVPPPSPAHRPRPGHFPNPLPPTLPPGAAPS